MNPLSNKISDDRFNLFVGRQAECQWMTDWLKTPEPPTQIFAVAGTGGVGKSTLLTHLLQIAQGHGAETAWVDGRTCYRTPSGFLTSLPHTFENWTRQVEPRPLMVLAVDNYDAVQVLESWLREVFFADLPDTGLLVLLASRTNLMGQWILDPGWNSRVEVRLLDSFTREEVEDFLTRRKWPLEEVAAAHRLSLGHPLSLAVLAEARQRALQDPRTLGLWVREALSARLLREITDSSLQPLVDVLTIMAEANLDILQRVLQKKVSPQQYQALKDLSFVKTTRTGVSLHDIAAMHLFDDFLERDPAGFEQIRQQAVTVLLNDWDTIPDEQHGSLAQHLLWLCRDVFHDVTEYADLSYKASDLYVTGYWPEDYDDVQRFIADWGRQSFPLSLFELIAVDFPEAIRITRTAAGRPVAIFVSLMLYDVTLDLLQKYQPTAVSWLLDSDLGIQRCPIEEANASLNVLTGIDKRQTAYGAEQILGVMARDQFSLQAGILGLLILANPVIKQFLRAVGYQSLPFPVSGDSEIEEELFVLDLRRHHFGHWIRQILSRRLKTGRDFISVADVRYFMVHWNDPISLRDAKLATLSGHHWHDLQEEIRRLIDGRVIEPLTVRDQKVLRIAFIDKPTPAWAAADKLHVSRATFYRYQEQALTHLGTVLNPRLES